MTLNVTPEAVGAIVSQLAHVTFSLATCADAKTIRAPGILTDLTP